MRNLVAGWLNLNWGNAYTTAQEPELANNQRMDIWLQNPNVQSPVPVELKVLDKKSWTGPKLCERLRNQLAGDYLREGRSAAVWMLLVWRGSKPGGDGGSAGDSLAFPNFVMPSRTIGPAYPTVFPISQPLRLL